MRALEQANVDLAFLTEAKLTGGIHARRGNGYDVIATNAMSKQRGGVALCYRKSDHFEVEETVKHGPNVMAFQLETGRRRYYVVGAYLPPSDTTTIDHVRSAWAQCPKGCTPWLLGDLNVNLMHPLDERGEEIAEECRSMMREGRRVSSQPDYFLAREEDRRDFRGVTAMSPRHHVSDHRAVIATVYTGSGRRLQRYRRRRSRFPIRLQKRGPRTHAEQLFEELKVECGPPPIRERTINSWIQPETWALVDARAALRREGKLNQQALRTHNRRVNAALKTDRSKRAADVGEQIEATLGAGEM